MIEELYSKINGDYNIAISRMLNDERITKYLNFFLADDSFTNLKKAIEEKDCQSAFNAAHTLKGVSQNMAFTYLSEAVEEITELLRARNLENAIDLFPEVSKRYKLVIEEIKKIN